MGMPIYEYHCLTCGREFEALVRGEADAPRCPGCQGSALERMRSLFAVSSEGTRQTSLQAARKANKKVQLEKAVADREMIEHHHDH